MEVKEFVDTYNQALDKLSELGIQQRQTGYCVCPACDHTRKKKGEKKLHCKFDDGSIVFNCNHCGDFHGFVVYGDRTDFKPKKKVYLKPKPKQFDDEKEKLYKRFTDRGISRKTVDLFEVKYKNDSMFFPYYKNDEVVNIKRKHLTDKKSMNFESGCEMVVFGMKAVDKMLAQNNTDAIVITEGEEEAMCYAEIGIPAVSVPNGASLGKNCLDYFDNSAKWLNKFKEFIIATDNDDAGVSLRDDLIKRIGAKGTKSVKIIDYGLYNVKDGNDLLKMGVNLLQKAFDNMELPASERVITFKDVFQDVEKMYNGELSKPYKTGWNGLDNYLQIKTGNLMVVGGYSGRGKSFFVSNLLYNLTEKYNWNHLLFHFENSVSKYLVEQLEIKTRKPFFDKGNIPRMNKSEKDNASIYLNRFFEFGENNTLWSIPEIIEKIRERVFQKGIKTVLIDPYNRIKKEFGDKNETNYIEQMLAELSGLARELDILIIFIAHPTKPTRETENRTPTLYETAGSQSWFSMCDYGIVIHREKEGDAYKYSKQTQVSIQKVKTADLGLCTKYTLHWDSFKLIDKNQQRYGD